MNRKVAVLLPNQKCQGLLFYCLRMEYSEENHGVRDVIGPLFWGGNSKHFLNLEEAIVIYL